MGSKFPLISVSLSVESSLFQEFLCASPSDAIYFLQEDNKWTHTKP